VNTLICLVANYLNQHTFSPAAVELTVENLSPRSEIKFAFGNCYDDFPANDLTFEVGVSVIFACAIVARHGGRRVRR
jgi:hypothetical protein